MPRDLHEKSQKPNSPQHPTVRAYSEGTDPASTSDISASGKVDRSHAELQERRYATVGHPVVSEGSEGLFPLESPALLASGGFLTLLGLKNWRSFLGLGLAGVGSGLIFAGLKKNRVFDPDFSRRLLNTMATEGSDVTSSITIARPVEEVYAAWRDFSNLAQCMKHIDSVHRLDETHWHWIARAPRGDMRLRWDAEIIEEVENEILVWRSVQGSEINNEGMVEFIALPDGQRTEIHAKIVYFPPAGKVGQSLAEFLKGLSTKFVQEDLHNFKQFVETGEVSTIEGQTSGRLPVDMPADNAPHQRPNQLR